MRNITKGFMLVAELAQDYKNVGYSFVSHDEYIEVHHQLFGSLKLSEDKFLKWMFDKENLKEIGIEKIERS